MVLLTWTLMGAAMLPATLRSRHSASTLPNASNSPRSILRASRSGAYLSLTSLVGTPTGASAHRQAPRRPAEDRTVAARPLEAAQDPHAQPANAQRGAASSA